MSNNQKPDIRKVPRRYYLAPAVLDQTLVAMIKYKVHGNTRYSYSAEKKGETLEYRVRTPNRNIIIRSESWLREKESSDPAYAEHLVNFREQLHTPFGLVNWLDNPKVDLIKKQLLIQDSGGFQIAVGREDFLSPETVLSKHQNIDLGISLDLPLIGFGGAELSKSHLEQIVSVTRGTNAFFESKKFHKYLNVNHGSTLRERLTWLDKSRTKDDKAAGLSIGGLRISLKMGLMPEAFASTVVTLIKNSDYKYFHVLGATAGWQMVILASIAARYKVTITSDSSSWIQQGISGSLLDRNLEATDIPPKGTPGTHRKLLCSCFMCRIVDDTYTYSANAQFLLPHNLLMMDRVAAELSELFIKDPETSVNIPLPYVKTSLKGVDDYIRGKKTWDPKKPIRFTNKPNSKSLFGRVNSINSDGERLLKIADDYRKWFSKNGIN